MGRLPLSSIRTSSCWYRLKSNFLNFDIFLFDYIILAKTK